MKRHLIALDLDGTLLTSEQTISKRNKAAIDYVRALGHIVVIATGRPHRASIDYYNELSLDTPMVNFNGALLHHPKDEKWHILHSPMGIRSAKKIIQSCYNFEVKNIMAEVRDDVYLDKYDEEVLSFLQAQKEDDPITIGSLKNTLTEDPTSLLIIPKNENIDQLCKCLSDDHADAIEHRNWGAPYNFIEIVRKGINKAVGLEKIAHYYHIERAHIIAFGDEDNDIEMLDYAAFGIKMGNGNACLDSVINETTATNDEDGVALFLEKYFDIKN